MPYGYLKHTNGKWAVDLVILSHPMRPTPRSKHVVYYDDSETVASHSASCVDPALANELHQKVIVALALAAAATKTEAPEAPAQIDAADAGVTQDSPEDCEEVLPTPAPTEQFPDVLMTPDLFRAMTPPPMLEELETSIQSATADPDVIEMEALLKESAELDQAIDAGAPRWSPVKYAWPDQLRTSSDAAPAVIAEAGAAPAVIAQTDAVPASIADATMQAGVLTTQQGPGALTKPSKLARLVREKILGAFRQFRQQPQLRQDFMSKLKAGSLGIKMIRISGTKDDTHMMGFITPNKAGIMAFVRDQSNKVLARLVSIPMAALEKVRAVTPGSTPRVEDDSSKREGKSGIFSSFLGRLFQRVEQSTKQGRLDAGSTEVDHDFEREWNSFSNDSEMTSDDFSEMDSDDFSELAAFSTQTTQTQMEHDFPEVFEVELPSADNRARIQTDNDNDAAAVVPPHAFLMGLILMMLGGVISQAEMEQALQGMNSTGSGSSVDLSAALNGPLTSIVGGTPNVLHNGLVSTHVGSVMAAEVINAVRRESQFIADMITNGLGGQTCDVMFDESFDWDNFLCSFSFA